MSTTQIERWTETTNFAGGSGSSLPTGVERLQEAQIREVMSAAPRTMHESKPPAAAETSGQGARDAAFGIEDYAQRIVSSAIHNHIPKAPDRSLELFLRHHRKDFAEFIRDIHQMREYLDSKAMLPAPRKYPESIFRPTSRDSITENIFRSEPAPAELATLFKK